MWQIQVDQEIQSQDADREPSDNQLLCAESDQEYDSLGEPEVLPRVGDEYQVKLPPFVIACDQVLPENWQMYVGLPLSIMWVPQEGTNIKQESTKPSYNLVGEANKTLLVKSELPVDSKTCSESCEPKVEPVNVATAFRESDKSALQHEICKSREQRYCPLPCSLGDSWDDKEQAAFLLGLYIFGKNLVLVQKFVESKKMGDMLAFYYGKFYRSVRYRRWSECRKMRSRKCIYGQKIFTGSRQQELLSRLLSHLPDERHNALLEVSKSFGEGKILFEEYVFRLKATVGLDSLINAVGIGKGKEDLTGIALEPLKANHASSSHSEIPVGKAWSMLTPLEIINFLTGNYRLSKARSNDLFWEAVWPRLLARGWHSEQPKDHVYAVGPKHCLVFLIPGVKKFSRRKLVKGNHYFDSVSDVLNRVASDPRLLELENGEQGGKKEESGFANGSRLEKNDSGNQQQHFYLKPRTPSRCVDFMKFTIVDTSSANGGKCKIRELRALPVDMNSTLSKDHSDDSEQESSEDSTDKSVSDSSQPAKKCGRNCRKPADISLSSGLPSRSNISNKIFQVHASGYNEVTAKPEIEKTKIKHGMLLEKAVKEQPSSRRKLGEKGDVAPAAKRRRRITACSRSEATQASTSSTNLAAFGIKQKHASSCRDSLLVSASTSSKGVPLEQKLSSPSPSCSSCRTSEATLSSTTRAVADNSHDEVQPRVLIDLNLPVPPESETDEHFKLDVIKKELEELSKGFADGSEQDVSGGAVEMKPSVSMPQIEAMPAMNSRRQSTRNRPLTTKALEALACGFLSTNQKRKRMDRTPPQRPSKSSRQARGEIAEAGSRVGSIVNIKPEERGNHHVSNCNGVIEEASNVIPNGIELKSWDFSTG